MMQQQKTAMNPERLLAHYEKIADAPDAVARLRRFVLDLAVRGKLVPQDANDEPASELLRAISAKRRKMAESGLVRPAKALPEKSGTEVLFDLPVRWAWTNANHLWDFENGDRSKNYPSKDQLVAEGVPFINAGHLEGGLVSMKDMNFISWEKFRQLGGGKVRRGDQLYCLRGSLGKHAIYLHDGDAAIASSLVILRPIEPETVPYLSKYLDSDIARTMLKRFDNGTAQPNLSSANLRRYEVPLPPLAEQRRIVAKVDELMGLCDRLEAAQAGREATRDRLSAASLARLNAPDAETFQADARFALDALPALTTRPDQIKRLRQTILNFAVRGKLVPQDPSDEPASELLKRIAKEKARLVKAGEIKVRSISSRDRQEPIVFDTPIGWSLTELGEVALKITDGAHKTPTYVERGVPFVSVKDFSAGSLDLSSTRFIPEHEHKLLYQRCDPRRGDILLGRIGTLGKAVLVDTDIEFSLFVSVGLIRFDHRFTNPDFFRLLLNSPFVEAEFDRIKIGGGTHTNKLNLGDLYTVALPLPPLAEQHRIVAKVDALMALCDRLEASLTATAATRRHLLDALLAEALAPAEARELEAAE